MKFMFVIHHDEKVLDAMPEKEMQALVDSAIEYAEEIRRSGHFIVSNALQRTSTARTIRVHAGKVTATDGPFAETKEQVDGRRIRVTRTLGQQLSAPTPAAAGVSKTSICLCRANSISRSGSGDGCGTACI
jgi:hypothetical protein